MQIEVRCCCNPTKLMGWLEMENLETSKVSFPIPNGKGQFDVITLEFSAWSERDEFSGLGRHGHAFKADGISIEQLKRIKRFVPNE